VGILNPHLDDAAFAEVAAARLSLGQARAGGDAEDHIHSCAECRARYATFSAWLETLRTDARTEADEAFGVERLAQQEAQVLRRLEALEHPARVIAFPRFAQPLSGQQGLRHRWVAAAAAAGLIVGVGLGQVFEFGTVSGPVRQPETLSERQIARGTLPAGSGMGVQPISQLSDEIFLDQYEITPPVVPVPESLQYLNAITPSVRDYDPR
jgi:hypothetical protein